MNDPDAYIRLSLQCPPDSVDVTLAILSDHPVHGIEERTGQLLVFIPSGAWSESLRDSIEVDLKDLGAVRVQHVEVVQQQNWNKKWEETIRPVTAGRFHVRPSWEAAPPDGSASVDIVIDPKMSFGTGHHESTRLSLHHLDELDVRGGRILDVGTGTGVLAIAAALTGARQVLAVDNDRWSVENAVENVDLNGVQNHVEVRLGSLDECGPGPFSVILANINRETLLRMMPGLARLLEPGGVLVLAGLLTADEPIMLRALEESQLAVIASRTEGEWWSVRAEPAG